jgi:transposase
MGARLEIELKEEEAKFLKGFVRKGERKAREILRANILLLSNDGERVKRISKTLSVDRHTVWEVKKRYLDEGLLSALKDKPRSGQPKKYTIRHETEIVALACTKPPGGRKRWTLVLLEEELKKREGFETINRESIRLILKKAKRSRGRKERGAFRI